MLLLIMVKTQRGIVMDFYVIAIGCYRGFDILELCKVMIFGIISISKFSQKTKVLNTNYLQDILK